MPRRNGSYFGVTVDPTTAGASGIWRVREAEEYLRANKWPAAPGVPGSPVGVPGDQQVSLAWSAPSFGSPPTDYQVQYSSNSGASWTTFADGVGTATSAVVTGLTNGTGYIFRVRAVNASGEGPYGAASGNVVAGIQSALLLRFDGSNGSTTFADGSGNAASVTASGSAQISTLQSKFGGASGRFPGGGNNCLKIDRNAPLLNVGLSDFTIEWWEYLTSVSGNIGIFFYGGSGQSGSATQPVIGLRYENNSVMRVGWNMGSNSDQYVDFPLAGFATEDRLATGVWVHSALVRHGGTLSFYRNGNRNTTTHNWSSMSLPNANAIAPPYSDSTIGSFNGFVSNDFYLDDFRIVKGAALYTANFTPPTAAL